MFLQYVNSKIDEYKKIKEKIKESNENTIIKSNDIIKIQNTL